MTVISPLDVIEITVKMTQHGQQLRNIYQVIHTAMNDVDYILPEVKFRDWMEECYAPLVLDITDELSFDSVLSVNLTKDQLLGEVAFATLTTGSGTAQASPLQISAVVRFPTDYRGSQGRKFIPGLHENTMDANGILIASTIGSLTNYAAQVLEGPDQGTTPFVVGVSNTEKARFAAFQSALINTYVGTQRRRAPGRGI